MLYIYEMFALSPSKRDSLWACGTLTLFICCTLYYYYSLSCFCNTLYLSACSYITGITILMILNSLKIDFPLLLSYFNFNNDPTVFF